MHDPERIVFVDEKSGGDPATCGGWVWKMSRQIAVIPLVGAGINEVQEAHEYSRFHF